MKLKANDRKKLGNKLHSLTTHFHNSIPLDKVSEFLSEFDLILLQEDNTEWSGLLCGREANTVFTLGQKSSKDERGMYKPARDSLYFYWYKHTTGRYEINMYLC